MWPDIAAQWNLTGLYKKIDRNAVALLLNCAGKGDDERDKRAQDQIDLMANFYKLKLENRFQKQYPSNLSSMMTFVLEQQHEIKQYQNVRAELFGLNDATVPMVGSYGSWTAFPDGTSLFSADSGIFGSANVMGTTLYFVQAPVTNTTLAGAADNGTFAGIVAPAQGQGLPPILLYINKGTLASPNWMAWDPQGLVDFVLSGAPLLECGYQRVRYYIRDYATDSDEGEFENRLKNMPGAAKVAYNRATEEEEEAFELVRIDMSGIGQASDSSMKSQEVSGQFF